jgi:hypothetical protein
MADTQIYQDKIGFLAVAQDISFDGGELLLLPEYAENAAYVDTRTHQDGFVYPPEVEAYERHIERSPEGQLLIKTEQTPLPKTRRPATLYRLLPSHELRLPQVVLRDAPRFGDASFVLQAIAFAYGVRLQFFDWWFDGRVPIHPGTAWHVTRETVADFTSSAYRVWQGYGPDSQKLIINLLYTTTRAISYHFDWERFIFSYMVLDGCFALAKAHHGVTANSHGSRIQAMCTHFGIPIRADSLTKIVALRNKLFHESLWADRVLGSQGGQDISILLLSLRKIGRRVLAALLGFNGHFVRSEWWTLDKDWFER